LLNPVFNIFSALLKWLWWNNSTKRKNRILCGSRYLCLQEKKCKIRWGLGKAKTKRWVEIYAIDSLDIATHLFKLFFNNQEQELQKALYQEEKYKSMLAAD